MSNQIRYSRPNLPKKLDEDDIYHINKILASGWVASGYWVEKLENVLTERFGVTAICCANCTSGLIVAIKALDIKYMRVLLPAFTWPSTLYAVQCNANKPIFADIDKETWMMDSTIGEYNVIVPVDIFGNQVDIQSWKPIIYDAAHGFDLPLLGKRGGIEVVSMSFTKPVTSILGGFILTKRNDLIPTIRELVNTTARMGEINAYFGLKSIDRLKEYNRIKQQCMDIYKDIKFPFTNQKILSATNHSVYSVLFESQEIRDKIANTLRDNNIEVKIYYEPLYVMPNTDWVYKHILSLPTYSSIIASNIVEVINNL